MKTRLHSERGSILLVALMFAGIVALALTSYLQMTSMALDVSQRSFLANDSMNVTEAGLERALWSFNQANSSNANAWTDWSDGLTSNDKRRTFTYDNTSFSQNATGTVRVYVKDYNSPGVPVPIAVAKATITPARGAPIIKEVEVFLARRSFFSTGLVGKRGVRFNGNNTQVDSWVSGVDTNPGTPIAYTTTVRRPYGSVAALSVTADVSVQNADIYGYVSVGSEDIDSHVSIGSQGIVSGSFAAAAGTRDTSRIAGNFTADLPDVSIPAPTTFTTVSGQSVIDGGTYPKAAGNGAIQDPINASDQTYYYKASSVDLDSAHGKTPALTIRTGCKVVFILQGGTGGSGTEVVGTGNTSILTIQSGATLAVYTAGNVRLTGLGVANQNGSTTSFQVWGTNSTPAGQTVQVSGNGGLTGIVYAPNATINVTGNGDIKGAIIGDTITLNGNGNFHYDESLANFGGSNPFKVAKWRELVSETQRNTYTTELNF
jgi:hypothetical protein